MRWRRRGASTGCWRKAGEAAPNGLWGELFRLAQKAQANGWQAEALLRAETERREKALRKKEKADNAVSGLNLTTEFMSDPRYDVGQARWNIPAP